MEVFETKQYQNPLQDLNDFTFDSLEIIYRTFDLFENDNFTVFKIDICL